MTELEQRARELAKRIIDAHSCSNSDCWLDVQNEDCLALALTAAFNEGANGAYANAAGEVRKFAAAAQSSDNNILINFLADQVAGKIPADALAAINDIRRETTFECMKRLEPLIQEKVSEARLAALNEFRIALRVCIEQRGNASFIAEYLPGGIFHNDTMKRIAQLQAEATRNPNESA